MTKVMTETKNREELNREAFEEHFCDVFRVERYSKPIANEIKDVLISLAMQKKSAPDKLLGFIARHKDKVGTDDVQKFITIIKQIGSRILADERKKEIDKRKDDPEINSILNELNKKLSAEPIKKLLSGKCISDHIRLIGSYPTKEDILELFRFKAFCEPLDYLMIHMKTTRYRSPVNYAKALYKHLSIITNQVLAN